jgi:hypothetical protein
LNLFDRHLPSPVFTRSVVEHIYKGKQYAVKKDSNGFPIFTIFETYLDDKHINSGDDSEQFKAANERLADLLRKSPELSKKMGLTEKQKAFLTKTAGAKKSPPGLTWHHHQDAGKMQLVNMNLHARFNHVGGMEIWGGGRQ